MHFQWTAVAASSGEQPIVMANGVNSKAAHTSTSGSPPIATRYLSKTFPACVDMIPSLRAGFVELRMRISTLACDVSSDSLTEIPNATRCDAPLEKYVHTPYIHSSGAQPHGCRLYVQAPVKKSFLKSQDVH